MILGASPAMKKAVGEALKKMESGKSDPKKTRAGTDAMIATRRKETDAKNLAAARKDSINLPSLEKEYSEMQSKYEKLGGKNYQYADREQNLTTGEREARSMEPGMGALTSRIGAIKKAGNTYAKGGKISLKDCSVSTMPKGKRNSGW